MLTELISEVTFIPIDQNNPADVRNLSRLATGILKQHFDPIVGPVQNDYMLSMFQSETALKQQMKDGYRYYLVKERTEDAGFLAFYPRNGKMYLSKFYLHQDFRGRQISSKMLSFVKQEAGKEHLPAIFLNVNRKNFDVISIYEHMGFHIVREEKNDIGHGFFMDDYVMEYPLS